jgi:hypothetical protein
MQIHSKDVMLAFIVAGWGDRLSYFKNGDHITSNSCSLLGRDNR